MQGESSTVFSTLKHFPGHGAAPGDSHHAIPTTAETVEQWRAADAKPFVAGIDAGAELLMFGHLAYTAVDTAPASLSARWHAIARDELGFRGVVISDDLGAAKQVASYSPGERAVRFVAAGGDMVLTVDASQAGEMCDALAARAASDAGFRKLVDAAALRVLEAKQALGLLR